MLATTLLCALLASPPAPATPDGGAPTVNAQDEAVIEHLDELEKLDLLQNLDLFDTGAEEGEDGGAPDGGAR